MACNRGLRPGEQRFLEFGDIDLRHDFLRIQSKPRFGFQVKNYQHRYVPLPPDARDAVQAQWAKKHASSDFVFHRPDGSPWGDIGGSFDELIVSAGLEKQQPAERVTPHSLRHTYASRLAIAGVSLRRIQELLGHKSIVTTERYSHFGHSGVQPYYLELAKQVSRDFCTKVCNHPPGTRSPEFSASH